MGDLQLLWEHLRQPEYLHVLLNPVPVYGMAAGAFVLIVSLLWRGRDTVAALLWLVLTAVVSGMAFHYGHAGYDRVFAMSNPEAQEWLDVHMHRAEMLIYVFYLVGITALAALLSRRKWPAIARILEWAAVVLSLLSAGMGGWISQAGGQVRHSEFRDGPPSPAQLSAARKDHDHHEGEHHDEHE